MITCPDCGHLSAYHDALGTGGQRRCDRCSGGWCRHATAVGSDEIAATEATG